MKKTNILIPDLLKDTLLENKVLGKKYNIFLRKASEFNNLTDKFLSKIDGVMTGHHVKFDSKKIKKLINRADVNLSKSSQRKKPCGTIILESSLSRKDYELTIEKCSKKSLLVSVESVE